MPTITPNLPSNQLHALSELRRLTKEKKLLITESDKGGYICLFDPSYIREMGLKTLSDISLFIPTTSDCEDKARMEIKTLIKNHKPPKHAFSVLTDKEEDYITNFESKIASLYLLPKVLKSQDVG